MIAVTVLHSRECHYDREEYLQRGDLAVGENPSENRSVV